MFSKGLVLSALLAVAYCGEHSYSIKTEIKHEQPKKQTKHESIHYGHQAASSGHNYEHHDSYSGLGSYATSGLGSHDSQSHYEHHEPEHKDHHAYSSQSIVRHDTHHEQPKKESKHEEHHESHGHNVHYHHGHEENHQSESHHHQAEESHQSHDSHHHAYSSQSIHREDKPGKAPKDHEEHYGHPKYEFEYKVEDHHTGDIKSQHEARDGDVVKGVYSLHEPNGSVRIVHYDSDKKSGFNAHVHHDKPIKHEYHHHH